MTRQFIAGTNLIPFNSIPTAFIEQNGLVVMEAENYQYSLEDEKQKFSVVTNLDAANDHSVVTDSYLTLEFDNYRSDSPRLDFNTIINQGMTPYFVWIRGKGSDDAHTCNIGTPVADGHNWSFFGENIAFDTEMAWQNTGEMGAPAQVVFDTPGMKTISLWMGSGEIEVDRILLTTDPTYIPKDEGPAESTRLTL